MNEFKSLLWHLDAVPLSRSRLELVKTLAAAQGARVEVLYAVLPWVMQYPFALDAGGMAAGQLALCQAEARDEAKTAFERECGAVGLSDLSWREASGDPLRALRHRAWAADLMVLSQHDLQSPAVSGVPGDFVPSALVDTGKPGLVLPYVGVAPDGGQNVLVAWKPTPESARAMTAALPILQRARQVQVACWDETGEAGSDVAGPALQFLKCHGIAATAHLGGRPTRDLGETLLTLAADLQADLLVMGCYGHGRAREWALGGVTRTVLQSMTLPVLMVH